MLTPQRVPSTAAEVFAHLCAAAHACPLRRLIYHPPRRIRSNRRIRRAITSAASSGLRFGMTMSRDRFRTRKPPLSPPGIERIVVGRGEPQVFRCAAWMFNGVYEENVGQGNRARRVGDTPAAGVLPIDPIVEQPDSDRPEALAVAAHGDTDDDVFAGFGPPQIQTEHRAASAARLM
ncbi:hypothetical protein IU433_10050 [Nocardia puris]|uniref:hypothetical protein n=1 Tax=Nocardia puris TaxID=208602 RepID=UPI0011BD81D7|nr:hypothetical protein [Nocardia puris]MBF6210854.1 hypothetical protein [Nocardia puris]MBF6459378.1 hypothetical protein [Nocardia puris]